MKNSYTPYPKRYFRRAVKPAPRLCGSCRAILPAASYGRTTCANCIEVAREVLIDSVPGAITYTNWNKETKRWNPNLPNTRLMIITDRAPKRPNEFGTETVLCFEHGGTATCMGTSVEDVKAQFAKLFTMEKGYADYDWAACNPRIVKAPCAWDAHKHGILVEKLEVPCSQS